MTNNVRSAVTQHSMALRRNQSAWAIMIVYLVASTVWILIDYARVNGDEPYSLRAFLQHSWPAWLGMGLGAGMMLVLINMFTRKMRRQELRLELDQKQKQEREAQSRAVLENAADAIISADEYGRIHLFNPAASRIFGYPEKEVLGQNIKMLIPRPYLPEHESYRTELSPQANTKELTRIGREVTGRRKDGTSFPLELAVSEVKKEPHRLFIAVARDITERKQAEAALEQSRQQLRSLAGRLQAVREEERTHIAREIHDVLGQALTGVKMDLSWIKARLPQEQVDLQERADMMSELVDSTIQTVRKIATELRPGILDTLGLVAALEWQAEEFQNRNGVDCHCISSVDEDQLEPAHQTALFRIFQETLTNVARHAQATRVEATLETDSSGIQLRIHDNGRGITSQELTGASSLGLLGIRERAAMLGGEVDIVGRPGTGTTVTTRIPNPNMKAPQKAS